MEANSPVAKGKQIDVLLPLGPDDEGSLGVWEVVRVALSSLTTHKLRSLLTMLGIIIGVMAVVALISLGDGLNSSVTRELRSMGTNILYIYPSFPRGSARDVRRQPMLTQTDLNTIAALKLPLVGVVPQMGFSDRLVAPSADMDASISATTPDAAVISNYKFASGSFFDEEQTRSAAPVIVIGWNIKTALFGSGEALGQMVRLRGNSLRVVGVMSFRGGMGDPTDRTAFVPITFAQQRMGLPRTPEGKFMIGSIVVSAKEDADLNFVQAQIRAALREQRHLKLDGTQDDFQVENVAAIIQQAQTILGALTLFLGSVAGISLLVGGIGIMNIMLVSVTERTKEIGLRKAVGAQGSHIMFQFIVEALVMSMVGGLIGLLLGSLIAYAVTASKQFFDAPVTPGAVLLALGFSMAVGLFFGIYPARRAAKLNPIDALRFE